MKTKIYILVILVSFLFASCEKPDHLKKNNFNSVSEFLENPSVKNAIVESDIPIYEGENPPVLSGIYNADGWIMDVSPIVQDLYGLLIYSKITLYNQTASGKIDFKEEASGVTVYGTGGYIVGENGEFSIFQESSQTGEEAGLPSDISITVVLIMSGIKYSQGNLRAKGISIITKATSSNAKDYDIESIEKIWWMWEAYFTLQSPATKSSSVGAHSLYLPYNIKEIIRNSKLD